MKKIITYVFQTLFLLVSVISGQAMAGETVTYYHLDNLGSPVAASDEAGNLKWSEQYQPYGGRILKEGDGQNDIWFTGKHEDIGLTYMGARWYDAELGRFLAIDPVGFHEGNPQSFNRYAYANNNPYRYVDPNGESPLDIGFLLWDVGKLGIAIYSGHGVGAAAMDVLDSAIGVASPIPGVGIGLKIKRAEKLAETAKDVSKGVRKDLYPTRARKSTTERAKNSSRDADGNIACDKCGSNVPENKVTMQHDPALVDTHNSIGWNTDQATRNNLYNDTITGVNCRTCQAKEGGSIGKTYRADTGPNFKPRSRR